MNRDSVPMFIESLSHCIQSFVFICNSLGYFMPFCVKWSLFNQIFLLIKKKKNLGVSTSSCLELVPSM